MRPENCATNPITQPEGVDPALSRPPVPDIPIDQLMAAVEGTKPYVRARLVRVRRLDDIDDVMQDIRLAAWDGLLKGHYRRIPGVSFEAWVQGIAGHLCAEHVRRTLAHLSAPFLFDRASEAASPVDIASAESLDRMLEREWVAWMLATVRRHVPAETWDLAVQGMTEARSRSESETGSGAADRRRWHAIGLVRQMALTVKEASEMDEVSEAGAEAMTVAAVACLPTALLRLVAERVVLSGVRGLDRARAIAAVASEVGVSVRYVEVKIGPARSLTDAALDVLQHGAGAVPRSSSLPASPPSQTDAALIAGSVFR